MSSVDCPLNTKCPTSSKKHKEGSKTLAEHHDVARQLMTHPEPGMNDLQLAFSKYSQVSGQRAVTKMNMDKKLAGDAALEQYEELYNLRVASDKEYVNTISALSVHCGAAPITPDSPRVEAPEWRITGSVIRDCLKGKDISSTHVVNILNAHKDMHDVDVDYPNRLRYAIAKRHCSREQIQFTPDGVTTRKGNWCNILGLSITNPNVSTLYTVFVPKTLVMQGNDVEDAVLEASYALLSLGADSVVIHVVDSSGEMQRTVTREEAEQHISTDILHKIEELELLFKEIHHGENSSAANGTPLSRFSAVQHAEYLAAWSHRDIQWAQHAVNTIWDTSDEEMDRKWMLTALWAHYGVEGRLVASTDYETNNGLSPSNGTQVIESGLCVVHPDNTVETHQAFHGLDSTDLRLNGTGFVDLHKVETADVEDQPRFVESSQLERTKELLSEGSLLVVHNAKFERSFLDASGVIYDPTQVLDTMYVAACVDPAGFTSRDAGSTLEDFTTRHGIPYEDAHSALVDAVMTMNALRAYQTSLHTMKDTIMQQHLDSAQRQVVTDLLG